MTAPSSAVLDVADLARRVRAGERAAVAQALALVEDRRPVGASNAERLFDALAAGGAPKGMRFGITGPPGAGKSSLLGALARHCRSEFEHRVSLAVIAVDPSSRVSGGALLGDRARIAPDPTDAGVFVRSLATGNELGGLAQSVPEAVLLLSYAFDWVIVETVGVGQSEADVGDVADVVAFVVQPGSGDVLQFLKAGIMELPDVFIVNKSDLEGLAARALRDLRHALHVAGAVGTGAPEPRVVDVSALTRANVPLLFDTLRETWRAANAAGTVLRRRSKGTAAWIVRRITRDAGTSAMERAGGVKAIEARVEAALAGGASPMDAARTARALVQATNHT